MKLKIEMSKKDKIKWAWIIAGVIASLSTIGFFPSLIGGGLYLKFRNDIKNHFRKRKMESFMEGWKDKVLNLINKIKK